MQLFELSALLKLDDSAFDKGVKDAVGAGEALKGKMSAMTVAVGNIVADMARKGFSAVKSMVSGAIDGFADYQQMVGGVETLFKRSASKVQQYAKQAYKTTGLSANAYMETVTSFSASLLQGLKGDTEAAAELANQAVVDMSDNANKMGTDMASIQNAYMGFAKQNYTMLDNLKLGYGGTKEEMVRLINDSGILKDKIDDLDGVTFSQIIQAIHAVQEQLGITGTTANEAAETISGSKKAFESAWTDLLTTIGSAGNSKEMEEACEKFKTAFGTYMENFLPTLVSTISGSGSLVTAIAESVADLPTDLLAQVAEGGLQAGTEMVGGVSKITNWLIDNITTMFKRAKTNAGDIQKFGEAIGEFLGEAITKIVTSAPTIASGIFTVGVNLAGGLVEGLFAGLFGSNSEMKDLDDEMKKAVDEANANAFKSSSVLDYMQGLINEYGEGAKQTDEFKRAQAELNELMPGASTVFQNYGSDVQGAVDKLKAMNEEMRRSAIIAAMNKKLSGQYELYGEKVGELAESKYNQGMAQQQLKNARETIIENLQTYAAEILKNPDIDQSSDLYQSWKNISEGKNGEGNAELTDLTIGALKGLVESASRVYGQGNGETPIWDQSQFDNLIGFKELLSLINDTDAEGLQKIIDDEIKRQEQLTAEIEQIEGQIELTTKLANDMVLGGSEAAGAAIEEAGTTGGSSIKRAAQHLGMSLEEAAAEVESWRGGGSSGGTGSNPTPREDTFGGLIMEQPRYVANRPVEAAETAQGPVKGQRRATARGDAANRETGLEMPEMRGYEIPTEPAAGGVDVLSNMGTIMQEVGPSLVDAMGQYAMQVLTEMFSGRQSDQERLAAEREAAQQVTDSLTGQNPDLETAWNMFASEAASTNTAYTGALLQDLAARWQKSNQEGQEPVIDSIINNLSDETGDMLISALEGILGGEGIDPQDAVDLVAQVRDELAAALQSEPLEAETEPELEPGWRQMLQSEFSGGGVFTVPVAPSITDPEGSFASGAWDVPYDMHAMIHKGERILTASQTRDAEANSARVTSEMLDALQSMRQDLQNMQIVVGRKAFGRAMVDYGGGRMDSYINGADDRYYAGYGER